MPQVNVGMTNSAIGGTGAFGATNPIPGVQGFTRPLPAPFNTAPVGGRTYQAPPSPNQPPPFTAPPQVYGSFNQPPQVIKPKNEGRGDPAMQAIRDQTTAAKNDVGSFFTNYSQTGQPNFDLLPQEMHITVASRSGLTPADLAEMGYKLVDGKWMQQNSAQAQQQQLTAEKAAQMGYGANTDLTNADFLNTDFMQQNIENNVSFSNQLRWDPTTNSYQKIGKLVAQGKLDLKTGKDINQKKKKHSRDNQQQQQRPQQASPQQASPQLQQQKPVSQYTGSASSNFNTAGG